MQFLNRYRFHVAEENRRDLALLRWALVLIFLWFGGMKFTIYEAEGSPRLSATAR